MSPECASGGERRREPIGDSTAERATRSSVPRFVESDNNELMSTAYMSDRFDAKETTAVSRETRNQLSLTEKHEVMQQMQGSQVYG